jgi:hypothetical protein
MERTFPSHNLTRLLLDEYSGFYFLHNLSLLTKPTSLHNDSLVEEDEKTT